LVILRSGGHSSENFLAVQSQQVRVAMPEDRQVDRATLDRFIDQIGQQIRAGAVGIGKIDETLVTALRQSLEFRRLAPFGELIDDPLRGGQGRPREIIVEQRTAAVLLEKNQRAVGSLAGGPGQQDQGGRDGRQAGAEKVGTEMDDFVFHTGFELVLFVLTVG